jgi:LysR family transcriptional activator of nhaA
VEAWFAGLGVRPRLVAECEDLALMKVLAAEGRGFIALPTLVADEAVRRMAFASWAWLRIAACNSTP